MLWAKLSHDRMQSVYLQIFDEIIVKNHNPELATREVFIRAEILKRNFSKRQLTILAFIGTFSYMYGKESAIIPKLKDFEIAGISITKIADELKKLEGMNVITWYRGKDTNEFSINDPREWQADYHSIYNDIRSRELFLLNLKDAGTPYEIVSQIEKGIAEDKYR